MSDEKKVKQKYLCFRYPEIVLVMNPEKRDESVTGHVKKILGKQIQFKRNAQGVGEYTAVSQDEIDFIESREFYGRYIKRAEGIDMSEFKVVRSGPEVVQGTMGTEAKAAPGAPAPEETEKPEKKVKVSKGLKCGPKPKEVSAA
jgi:hypothetical protein